MAVSKDSEFPWLFIVALSARTILAALVFLVGCATHRMYRPDLKPGEAGSSSAVWKDERGPYFGIVEFDDQGERWDSSVPASTSGVPATQLQAVTQAIKQAGGHGDKPFYLIVFAHGWNNDASPANMKDGENLAEFHQCIKGLRDFHQKDGVEVFGVYLAWRGKTPYFPFNFYDRNEGGHRVGERATGTVFELVAAGRRASSHSKIALIGHSFGCHIIESAVTPALQADIARAPLHGGAVDLAADLVLLINPARSSLYTKPLVDQMRDSAVNVVDPSGQHHKLPLIVTITSEGDSATGTWFPFGYKVGRRIGVFNTSVAGQYRDNPPRPGMRPDPEDQSFSHQHTAGWNPGLYSHKIEPEKLQPDQQKPVGLEEKVRANYRPWTKDGSILVHGSDQNYRITPLQNPYNGTPYWIMQVPKAIIPDHTTIWTDECICLVTALLYLPNHELQPHDPVRDLPSLNTAPRVFSQKLSALRMR